MTFALQTAIAAGIALAVVCLVVLGLLVVAPWRRVRQEKPLPEDVESRLLLGEDPEKVAEEQDEDAEGVRDEHRVVDLDPDRRSTAS